MYFYFYDTLAKDKRYETVIQKIENKIIELGITGRIEKVSVFTDANDIIANALKQGAKTLVAVGDDATLTTLVNGVGDADVTFGFIPLTENSRFAHAFGIPVGEEGCVVLSRRRFETVDLGHANDTFFLGALTLKHSASAVTFSCDDNYTVESIESTNQMALLNIGDIIDGSTRLSNYHDGRIELRVSPSIATQRSFLKRLKKTEERESLFIAQSVQITSKQPATFLADAVIEVSTPCTVTSIASGAKIIVGKDRILV